MEDVREASSTENAAVGDRHPSYRGNDWGEFHDRVVRAMVPALSATPIVWLSKQRKVAVQDIGVGLRAAAIPSR
jgi:hypothetical protein